MVSGSWTRFDHAISFVPSLVLLLQSRLFCLVRARFHTLHFRTFFFLFARLFSHICLRTLAFALLLPPRLLSLVCFRSFASARLLPLVCFRTLVFACLLPLVCFRSFASARLFSLVCFRSFVSARLLPHACFRSFASARLLPHACFTRLFSLVCFRSFASARLFSLLCFCTLVFARLLPRACFRSFASARLFSLVCFRTLVFARLLPLVGFRTLVLHVCFRTIVRCSHGKKNKSLSILNFHSISVHADVTSRLTLIIQRYWDCFHSADIVNIDNFVSFGSSVSRIASSIRSIVCGSTPCRREVQRLFSHVCPFYCPR